MKLFRRKKNAVKAQPREPRSVVKPMLWMFGVIATVVAAYGGWSAIRSAGLEEFRALEVTGEMQNVTAKELHGTLAPFIEQGFVELDIAAAQAAVESLAWVEHASVRRQWPGILRVEIFEQRPVATWYGTALLNNKGEIFIDGAAGYSGVLPDLSGPAESQLELLQALFTVETKFESLGQSGLELRRLQRSDRHAERLWLQNGLEIRLGRKDMDMRLERFIQVAWPVLRGQVERVAYVDMRYANGFAVGWKESVTDALTSGEG
jgi:cell division protein FtsQ